MDSIAFIDLKFHKKTKSSLFFQEILNKHFKLNVYYENERDKYIYDKSDKYIFRQVIPRFSDLIKIKKKEIILIPMYDGVTLNKLSWERYKCFKIKFVCFCKKVFDFFSDMGFECFYIQYYLPELKYNVDYTNKKIFFRYRGNITWEDVKRILGNQNVEITIKNNPDPGHKPLRIKNEDIIRYKINFQNKFFDTKDEYYKLFSKHSIFIAPRKKEGIGMSFLESMSIGQCVIAFDDATMNEYITNNENGILTKFDEEINLDNYQNIGKKALLHYKKNVKKRDINLDTCIRFIKNKYTGEIRKITLLDYTIDFMINIRRSLIKFKRFLHL